MNDFLEKTIEGIIFENKDVIHEYGFTKLYEHTIRQFKLKSGNIIDLFTYEIKDNILYYKIIEIKRDGITADSVWQIVKYFYEVLDLTLGIITKAEPLLIIVGSSMTDRVAILNDLDCNIDFYIYKYKLEGVEFIKLEKGMKGYYESDVVTPSVNAVEFCSMLRKPYGIYEMKDFNNSSNIEDEFVIPNKEHQK